MGPSAPHGHEMWLVEGKPLQQKLILSLREEAVPLPRLFKGLSDGQDFPQSFREQPPMVWDHLAWALGSPCWP